MKKTLFLIIVAAIISAGGYVWSKWTSYHNFEGLCLDCHITVPKDGDKPTAFTRNISYMCKDCHKEEQELSHPVDMKPSMAMPAGFPLDWKGEVTCATCHPIHSKGYGQSHLRSMRSGQGFCTLCHDELGKKMHQVSVGTAHASSTMNVRYLPGEVLTTLDDLSLKCMACHDAVFANDSLVQKMPTTGLFHNPTDVGLSHPIGVSYIEAKRLYKGAYRDVDKLPRQIKLFSGMVGCGSCHNPYSGQHSELVMSNERSALCLGCHVK